jgi:hypothetical protein
MNKKMVPVFFALVSLVIGAAYVSAQEVYADTDDAYNIGFIQGQADYSPKANLTRSVDNASRKYADGFVNNKGFKRTSTAYKTIRAAFENGYRAGWAEAAALRSN